MNTSRWNVVRSSGDQSATEAGSPGPGTLWGSSELTRLVVFGEQPEIMEVDAAELAAIRVLSDGGVVPPIRVITPIYADESFQIAS